MPRRRWSDAPLEWVQIVRGPRPKSEQWPKAPGHRQNRSGPGSHQRQIGSGGGTKRSSTPKVPQRAVSVVRERKTPEQVRSDASTKVSRLQAALRSLGDGDVEERRALELALSKAQKQAEDLPVARQIEVTKEFIARAKKRMLVADEKIRLAQVALQDAMEEKEYDIREVPLAEARLERLQKEIVPRRQTPPISTDLEAEVHRLRTLLAQMEASQSNLCRHPPKSSSQAADMLRERAAKRRAGVTESIPTDRQDLECWMSEKHLELRDAIEFGDQESILSLTDLIHQGAAQIQKFPSMVTNMVST